jgi:hypothetical protein
MKPTSSSVVDIETALRPLADGNPAPVSIDALSQNSLSWEEAKVFQLENGAVAPHPKPFVAKDVQQEARSAFVRSHNVHDTARVLTRVIETKLVNIEGFSGGRSINLVQAD